MPFFCVKGQFISNQHWTLYTRCKLSLSFLWKLFKKKYLHTNRIRNELRRSQESYMWCQTARTDFIKKILSCNLIFMECAKCHIILILKTPVLMIFLWVLWKFLWLALNCGWHFIGKINYLQYFLHIFLYLWLVITINLF